MEDGLFLNAEQKANLSRLQNEKKRLERVQKLFQEKRESLTVEEKEEWRVASKRLNEIHVEIKDMRIQNVLAGGI